ncbi:hypothetical protein L917_08124 [Phytophthora nicotianae]|nr:hypothetical protein L917_08124 [Phytophthora nicotianae]ETM47031.1 hypothetical protein L914_08189 [Phytophthora nicotianae]
MRSYMIALFLVAANLLADGGCTPATSYPGVEGETTQETQLLRWNSVNTGNGEEMAFNFDALKKFIPGRSGFKKAMERKAIKKAQEAAKREVWFNKLKTETYQYKEAFPKWKQERKSPSDIARMFSTAGKNGKEADGIVANFKTFLGDDKTPVLPRD